MGSSRVFMLGWEYPPHIVGGLGIACHGLARSLAGQGHNIIFALPRLFGEEPHHAGIELVDIVSKFHMLSAKEKKTLAKIFDLQIEQKHEEIYSSYESQDYHPPDAFTTVTKDSFSSSTASIEEKINGISLSGGYGEDFYFQIEMFADFIRAYSKTIEFDIIHAHDWMTFPAALHARKVTGKPLICHVHATEIDRSGKNINQHVFDLERDTYRQCDAIITVSNYTKKILIEKYGIIKEKIFPVYNAVEFRVGEEIEHSERPFKEKIVLFVGRITFQKGPDYFVKAAKIVLKHCQNVRFVMVGSGDLFHKIIEYAADLGIGRYFHYTGFLKREMVEKIYSMSNLYVMPSVSEPFGISPLEAMAHGVPTIVSKQSGVSEILQNCIKVDFWNIDELAASMLAVLQSDDLEHSMSNEGLNEIQHISWDESACKVGEIYNRILA